MGEPMPEVERPDADSRTLALEALVRFLVEEADMQRDTIGQWWAEDWVREVNVPEELASLLNELVPAGRTF
jgi:hypothetical protein